MEEIGNAGTRVWQAPGISNSCYACENVPVPVVYLMTSTI
jgi:hypothetical protein